ncbi:hypothetical protein OG21DRAFT_434620 [Imleria badia]|nr:hypothetical protein OG21DRAFT_434620 [Imleria badia]
MEYLDKNPDLSADPPMTHVTSVEDGFTSDHGHYAAPPMVLATPPTAYYPDHAYALHPNTFPADPSGSRGYPSPYPAAYTQDHAAQHIYSTDDYDIAYPPSVPPVHHNMPNPHGEFADVELVSTPVPPTQAVFPDALRPSAKSTLIVPKQWANTRFSVDSFYAGIATDNHPPSGQAL